MMQGSLPRLDALLLCNGLSDARAANLRNLRAAMDPNGVIRFSREYPSSVGGVPGGRATFRDTRKKGNTFLTCSAVARAYIFGPYYDEIDMSRSHFNIVLGCHALTNEPRPVTMLRFRDEQAQLESDIESELRAHKSELEHALASCIARGGHVPTKAQSTAIKYARMWADRASLQAKHFFSAVINTHSPDGWQRTFDGCTAVCTAVADIQSMCASLPLHPACVDYARALRAQGTETVRLRSLCLGHLDEHALNAAAVALASSGVETGLTVNDSLTIVHTRAHTVDPHDIVRIAQDGAAAHLGYRVTFSFLPHLCKPTDPPVTFAQAAAALGATGAMPAPLEPHLAPMPLLTPSPPPLLPCPQTSPRQPLLTLTTSPTTVPQIRIALPQCITPTLSLATRVLAAFLPLTVASPLPLSAYPAPHLTLAPPPTASSPHLLPHPQTTLWQPPPALPTPLTIGPLTHTVPLPCITSSPLPPLMLTRRPRAVVGPAL